MSVGRCWPCLLGRRAWEAKLNAWPQFTTNVLGEDIHFFHVRAYRVCVRAARARARACVRSFVRPSPEHATVVEWLKTVVSVRVALKLFEARNETWNVCFERANERCDTNGLCVVLRANQPLPLAGSTLLACLAWRLLLWLVPDNTIRSFACICTCRLPVATCVLCVCFVCALYVSE